MTPSPTRRARSLPRTGEITASVLQETVALQPVISIPQGTRVQIRPSRDWYIRKIS